MAERSAKRSLRKRGNKEDSPALYAAILSGRDQDGFIIKFIDRHIGHGVFSTKMFCTGDFLLEYKGEVITLKEGERRESSYSADMGSFLFFFCYDGKRLCIDATDDPFQLNTARMVNDEEKNPNCSMKIVPYMGTPHLCLFALKDIEVGDELRYDYGVENLPWRKQYPAKKKRKTDSSTLPHLDIKKKPDQCPCPMELDAEKTDIDPKGEIVPQEKAALQDEETAPQVEETAPQVEETAPQVEKTAPQVEKTAPQVEKTAPQVEKTAPQVEKTAPQKKTIPLEEKIATCEEKTDPPEETDPKKALTVYDDCPPASSKNSSNEFLDSLTFCGLKQKGLNSTTRRGLEEKVDNSCDSSDSQTSEVFPNFSLVSRNTEPKQDRRPVTTRECCKKTDLPGQSEKSKHPSLDSDTEDEENDDDDDDPEYNPEKEGAGTETRDSSDCEIEGELEQTIEDELEETDFQKTKNLVSRNTEPKQDRRPVTTRECCKKTDLPGQSEKSKHPSLDSETEDEANDDDDDDPEYNPEKEGAGTETGDSSDCEIEGELEQTIEDELEETDFQKTKNARGAVQRGVQSSTCHRAPEMFEETDKDKETNVSQKSRPTPVTIMMSHNSKEKRVWDKKHCCLYCMRLYPKLPRHLEQVHNDEVEVAEALSYPKNSAQRRLKLNVLRNKGNFAHNTQVLEKSSGELIPFRRPSTTCTMSDYLPCEDCLALFSKADLWKHKQNCPCKKNDGSSETGRSRRGTHQSSGAALLPVSREAQTQMRALILDTMANDDIAMVARNDDLIVRFGCKLFSKNGQERHQHQYIKQKMREISRFLMAMRERCPEVVSLSDCINPVRFQHAIEAVKEICKYRPEKGVYGTPSLALKLGHSLKKCAKYLRSSALQGQDDSLKKRAEEYRELVENEWTSEISAQALATLHEKTFNKPLRLPLAEDIKKLNEFLKTTAANLVPSMERTPTETEWHQLAEISLAQVVLFNRRRGGESERLRLSQYNKGIQRGEGHMQEEVAASLSPFERSLAKSLSRVEVRGKRGRKVPILLTEQHKKQIDLLNEKRPICGVSENNEYIFARSGEAKTPHRTSDVLKKFAERCNAEKPELVSSTSLRKHVATVSQLLNLKDNEMDILAGFMGHDIRIHRDFYRLPEDTLQVAKVSKILLELERGNIAKYKGKSLDEIQMGRDEMINDEELEGFQEEEELQAEPEHRPPTPGPTSLGRKITTKQKEEKVRGERTGWSKAEKDAVERQMAKFIRLWKVPGKRHCDTAKENEPALNKRSWKQIKYCVKNIITTNKRRTTSS